MKTFTFDLLFPVKIFLAYLALKHTYTTPVFWVIVLLIMKECKLELTWRSKQ